MAATLPKKIESKQACIGIIGLGYVGLPLALTVLEADYSKVIGFDVDPNKIDLLRIN